MAGGVKAVCGYMGRSRTAFPFARSGYGNTHYRDCLTRYTERIIQETRGSA